MRGARFVSQHKGLGITVQQPTPDRTIPDDSGRPHVVPGQRRIHVKFDHGLLTPKDIAFAKANLRFRGTVMDAAQRDIDPTYRMGVIDTEVLALQEGWTDAEHQLVINKLRDETRHGEFVEVEREALAAPWANYDQIDDPDRIVELAAATDADFAVVLEYELANQNRPAVLQALREAGETEDIVLTA